MSAARILDEVGLFDVREAWWRRCRSRYASDKEAGEAWLKHREAVLRFTGWLDENAEEVALEDLGKASALAEVEGAAPREGARGIERILCAAIWVDTGKAEPPRSSYAYPRTGLLFCGWRHGDCFTALAAWADGLRFWERRRLREQLAGRNQGFLTSRGRYVDRDEGLRVARAAGQVGDLVGGCLTSEDLY